ncbi:MAG: polysaccharide deacetylase family protein [Verrucomicrobia bacterium]|nr:polysaccharide deacetylase family protein [Verrucomicrobiota bacterium]
MTTIAAKVNPASTDTQTFSWPSGKRAAVSLTFDDARLSMTDRAIPILDAHGVKATFYVTTYKVEERLDGWRRAVANGHEIGNHTQTHPCSGNFRGCRSNPLEEYTLERIESDIAQANESIKRMLDVQTQTFAYPCGQKFVGRGEMTQSYVPIVSKNFIAGRGFRDEAPNDPSYCDLAQIYGVDSDRQSFDQLKKWIDQALRDGGWLVFVAHEVGDMAFQTMPAHVLEEVCRHCQDPANGLWIDTVAAIAGHVRETRTACGILF